MSATIPILTYHSIDSSGSVISTAPEVFREQMNFLGRSGYRTISLREVVGCIQRNDPFPEKAVAITFDDGFANFFDQAFPVMKGWGFHATVFLVTGHCGKDNQWDGQPDGIPVLDLMTWEQIGQLCEDGIEFGVHTVRHADLAELSAEAAKEEIVESKRTLQEYLGKEVHFFAHPYGRMTPEVQVIVRSEFLGACSTHLDFTGPGSDLFFLPRIDMHYFSKNHLFSQMGTPQFLQYVRFRSLLRSVRQRFEAMKRQ